MFAAVRLSLLTKRWNVCYSTPMSCINRINVRCQEWAPEWQWWVREKTPNQTRLGRRRRRFFCVLRWRSPLKPCFWANKPKKSPAAPKKIIFYFGKNIGLVILTWKFSRTERARRTRCGSNLCAPLSMKCYCKVRMITLSSLRARWFFPVARLSACRIDLDPTTSDVSFCILHFFIQIIFSTLQTRSE